MAERTADPAAERPPPRDGTSDLLGRVTWRFVFGLVAAGIVLLLVLFVASRLSSFFSIILSALFLSFALEPGVNWFAARGMRRGAASAIVFLIVIAGVALLLLLVIPAIVTGVAQLVAAAPALVERLAGWLEPLGIKVSQDKIVESIRSDARSIVSGAFGVAGTLFGIGSSIVGGIFRWGTIALFTFYLVAEGPRLRRGICSLMPPERQARILFIWEKAIEKTGGYFYSRLLLAIVNGSGMYIVLRLTDVPFAAPLAIFEGTVAAFVPIVGTYISGAVPIFIALLTSTGAGVAAAVYVVGYQQIENYVISPRLTARTMQLHPAVAFAATMIGGALGGILAAFLALPVAAVIQAAAGEWVRRYDVVEDELTSDIEPVPPPAWLARLRRGSGRQGGRGHPE